MPPEDERFKLAGGRAVAKVIDGDAIVIDTVTGRYYSLVGTGETVWSLLVSSLTLEEIAEALRERYDTGDADVLAEVRRLAKELVDENLLVPAAAADAQLRPTASAAGPAAYAPPEVTVFHDMEDLLAFDPPLPVSDVSVWGAGPSKP